MLFKKSQDNFSFGKKSGTTSNSFGKKVQHANNSARAVHNIIDTVHKVKSILEK
jgi:hypothetical protein